MFAISRQLEQVSRFDGLYGLQVVTLTPTLVEGRVEVGDHILQALGLVHGGVYAAIAEALASMGTNCGVNEGGQVALGLANQTSFLRPIAEGVVYASASRIHGGRATWVWDVSCHDDAKHLCAISRVTLAVRTAQTP